MICRRIKTKIENSFRQTARLKNTVLGNQLLLLNRLFYNYRKKKKKGRASSDKAKTVSRNTALKSF